jgi:chromosome segregation ATPase
MLKVTIPLVLLLKLVSSVSVANNDIENEISNIRNTLVRQEKEIRDTRDTVIRQEIEIRDTRGTLIRQEKVIHELQLEKQAYRSELQDLRHDNEELKKIVDKLTTALSQLQSSQNSYNAKYGVSNIKRENYSSASVQDGKIGNISLK